MARRTDLTWVLGLVLVVSMVGLVGYDYMKRHHLKIPLIGELWDTSDSYYYQHLR